MCVCVALRCVCVNVHMHMYMYLCVCVHYIHIYIGLISRDTFLLILTLMIMNVYCRVCVWCAHVGIVCCRNYV